MSSFIVGLRWVANWLRISSIAILGSGKLRTSVLLAATARLWWFREGMGRQALPMVRPPEHLLILPEEHRTPGRAPGTKSDTRPFRRTFCAAEPPTHPSPQSSPNGPIFRAYHLWNRRRRGAVLD
jgi:hypothetical protein